MAEQTAPSSPGQAVEQIQFSKAQQRRLQALNSELAAAQKEWNGYISYLADEHEIEVDTGWRISPALNCFQRTLKVEAPARIETPIAEMDSDDGVNGDVGEVVAELMQE